MTPMLDDYFKLSDMLLSTVLDRALGEGRDHVDLRFIEAEAEKIAAIRDNPLRQSITLHVYFDV